MHTLHLCQLHCFLIPCFHRNKWKSSVHPLIYMWESRSFRYNELRTSVYVYTRSSKYICILTIYLNTNKRTGKYAISCNPLAHLSPFPRKRPYKCDRNDCSINKYLLSYI